MKVPEFYKYIIKYVTPVLLTFVFLGSLITPKGNNWKVEIGNLFSGNGWTLDNGSIIKQITNAGIYEQIAAATDPAVVLQLQDKLFYVNGARILLLLTFAGICFLVYLAHNKRKLKGGIA